MKLKLLIYDLEINYLPGKEMHIADLLSRNYINNEFDKEINIEGVVHSINNTMFRK